MERRDGASRRCPPNCTKKSLSQSRKGFSLSKKQYSIFMLRAAARIQSNLLYKFINSGSMYLGIYTREEKMCPQDAVFLRDSLESVVSSERLFGKRSFYDSLKSLSQSRKGIFFLFREVFLNQLIIASSMQPGQERRTLPSATPLRSRHRYAPFFCSNFSLSIFVTL